MSILSDSDKKIIKAVVDYYREWEKDPYAKPASWPKALDKFLKDNNFKLGE